MLLKMQEVILDKVVLHREGKTMKCKYCKTEITDLMRYNKLAYNYICLRCRSHYFKEIWYNSKEWDKWINEPQGEQNE